MTSRERPASGGASLADRPAPASPRAGTAPAGATDLLPWDEILHSLSPDRQRELLALASRQGLLYYHQLPPHDPATLHQHRQLLPGLLAGKVRDLPPARPLPLDPHDRELDDAQKNAVARALATPDLALIQGLPGSGKSRVIAEVVLQAALAGERVLLLAPAGAALDQVLLRVGGHERLCPVRCVGKQEPAEALPAAVRGLTIDGRVRRVRDESLPAARSTAVAAREQVKKRQGEEAVLGGLAELVARQEVLTAKEAVLARRREELPAEVERLLGVPAGKAVVLEREHGAVRQRLETALAELQGRLDELRRQRQPLEAERDALRPQVEAKQAGRFWSPAWWKATLGGRALARHAELTGQIDELARQQTVLDADLAKLNAEKAGAMAEFKAARQKLADAETARLRKGLDAEDEDLRRESGRLDMEWQTACAGLAEDVRPAGRTADELARSRQRWQETLAHDEEQAELAGRWAAYLEEASDGLATRLAGCANLVAATLDSFGSDPDFMHGAGFDLLVLDEAERVTESEFLAAARRARRWVLVGEPVALPPEGAPAGPPRRGPSRPMRPANLRPGFFQKLWQHLHPRPRTLPFTWVREAERLRCRLRPIEPEHRPYVESEPMADSPEVELHFLSRPRTESVLAEVHFPPATPICKAKEFIYRELQQLPAHCTGENMVWHDSGGVLRLELSSDPHGDAHRGWSGPPEQIHPVPLTEGVREVVRIQAPGGTAEHFVTLGLEFDQSAGWTAERAEEWVAEVLGLRDPGRTAVLSRLHRPQAELAHCVAEVLFPDFCPPESPLNGQGRAALEFVPVPAPSRGDGRRRGEGRRGPDGPPGKPRPRGGAGFELDLSDTTHRELIPAGVRAVLPPAGLVNYFEATAVVQVLESLLSDGAFRAEAVAWSRAHAGPVVAVSALYAEQVVLLRHLVRSSQPLVRAGLTADGEGQFRIVHDGVSIGVIVDAPPGLRQREALAVLVSLTRSHTHRAVALGEDPAWLPLCLTRARGRLLLFGDAGTLHRRTQWNGPVDHLDEPSALRERELADRLVRLLGRHDPSAGLFPVNGSLPEGSA